MKLSKIQIFSLLAVILTFAVGVYFYAQLPETIASHWNAQGQVNGYMPKFWGVFLIPILSLGIFVLHLFLPKLDPLQNIQKFQSYYEKLFLVMFAFLLGVHAVSIAWNLGIPIDLGKFLTIGFAVVFYYLGIVLEHTKRNWFVGIRTPWTLSSDKIWDATHKKAAKMFRISGIIALLAYFFSDNILLVIVFPIISAVYAVIYSYLEFSKTKKSEKKKN
ncbi:MAG: DUF1648 domain-containing protein [Candidatus Diapherotrites archaeon]|nr:DUF1648 domain-containing protein [Candidatus Diapherotrites archaeon]